MKQLLLLTFLFGIAFSPKAQNTDPGQTVFDLLTGGENHPNGKTWKIVDKPHLSGMGVYKAKRVDLSYYDYPDGLIGAEWTNGALNNSYTFTFDSVYKPLNQNVTANWLLANYYLGTLQPKYGDVALVDPTHKEAKFSFVHTGNFFTGYNIVIQDGSYIGYFDKRNDYEIIHVSKDTLMLRHKYNDNDTNQDFLDPALDVASRLVVFVSETITSLKESNQGLEYDVDFYPNPSFGTIHVSKRFKSTSIYDNVGELLLESDSPTVNTNALPTGVYQMKLSDKSGNYTWRKVVIN